MRILRTLDELDEAIRACNEAERISDDHMRAAFATFCMAPPDDLPSDAFSEAYRQYQLDLYARIARRQYDVRNEVTSFDVGRAVRNPFPYYTRSAATAGEHVAAVGLLVKEMGLRPGSRVLEFGPGWGNTTILLAKLGCEVTAVDIEQHFCDLLRARAEHEALSLEVIQGDFFWAEQLSRRFDAVLFYECFHHCADHARLLRALDGIVAPGGCIFFAGEPIAPDFPMPWGIRLDGSSLWAIRKNGWLELGFQDGYFRQALARAGWLGRRRAFTDVPWLSVWRAERSSEFARRYEAGSTELRTHVGRQADGLIRVEGAAGTALFGPYVDLPAGRYRARIRFDPATPLFGTASMDVSAGAGTRLLGSTLVGQAADAELAFESAEDMEGVEVRLFADAGFCAAIAAVELERFGG